MGPLGLLGIPSHAFGVKNTAQIFQRLMDTVLQGLDFNFVYIDDILVASHSKAEHRAHVQQVFQCLQDHGLVLNLARCQFWQARDQFPGTSHYETQDHSFCMFIFCDPCFPPMFLRMQVNMPAYCSSCSCRCFREVLLLTSTFRPSSSLHQMFFAST